MTCGRKIFDPNIRMPKISVASQLTCVADLGLIWHAGGGGVEEE